MFGFLRPHQQDDSYRAAYARCCELLHQRHGRLSSLFHSYEAVWLYLYAQDAGAAPPSCAIARRCCLWRQRPASRTQPDAAVGQFGAAVSLLLASLKLSDDLRDEPTASVRLLNWLLRGRFRAARKYFTALDPGFERTVESFVSRHLSLERGTSVPLAEYCKPTAEAFGYVFSLMARLPGMGTHQADLCSLGEHIGSALIAFDCAVDWPADVAHGQYNPLRSPEEVAAALAFSEERLRTAAMLCRHRFGDASASASLVDGVAVRVAEAAAGLHEFLSRQPSANRPALGEVIRLIARPLIGLFTGPLGPIFGVMSFASSPQDEEGCCGQRQHAYYDSCGCRTSVNVPEGTSVDEGTDCCGRPTTTYRSGCGSTTVTEQQDCCGNTRYQKRHSCI